MRFPSEQTILRKCLRAYHRAQALARNEEYARDIQALVDAGLRFDPAGFYAGAPGAVVDRICSRSDLWLPVLPEGLRRLTLNQLLDWTTPVFNDVPGWTLEPASRKRLADLVQAARRGSVAESRMQRAFRYRVVTLRQLGKRDRGLNENQLPPHDLYSQYWRVYDLRREGKSEREIIRALWPKERHTRVSSWENDSLRQRVYDYEKRARKLIQAAYSASSRR